MKLCKYMYENFWNVEYNAEETKIFNDANSWCMKASSCYFLFMQWISVHLLVAPYLGKFI